MSESEMVERVAMAIARSRHGASLRWEQETGGLRQSALDDARAAIAAMREPTEAMMKAGLQHYLMQERADFKRIPFNGRTMFQFMMDKALK
jgi:hypothetical protein